MTELRFPAGLTTRDFLTKHWQREPLLMPQAIDVPDVLDANELAGLACDEQVESRIVVERDTAGPWAVRHGPFRETDFSALPESPWTLLVQDVDKFEPEVAAILEYFGFLPDWRVDDIMISYAVDGGSVGPHTDDYDVFLIQTRGRRRWQINRQPVTGADLIPGLDLRILRHFSADKEWILEPGDILYLPPRVPHWGVAIGECMTWSVGLRAPSAKELATGWLDHRLAVASDHRYGDAGLQHPEHRGQIPDTAVHAARALAQSLLSDDRTFAHWFCGFISEPKEHLAPLRPEEPLESAALIQALTAGVSLVRSPGARLLFHDQTDGVLLAASGTVFTLPDRLRGLVTLLSDDRSIPATALWPWLADPAACSLIIDLFNQGQLEFGDA